ncbi:hypothetical protein ACF1BN_19860 [Streptomyces sp. NPDC014861]|uniref:hypothetical protein n=1 Tax=Streptomyces sp. NPDC014861 TaxID=3364923 RepID=UPI0036FBAF93
MSFGEPNNPYGQPPQGQPGYGYPQAPQGVPQQGSYGYPAAPPVAPYGAYPGGPNQIPQSMPGLLMTARVFLFLISAVQIVGGIIYLIAALGASDASNYSSSYSGDNPFSELSRAAAGILTVVSLIMLGLAALSITLGVKFGNGGQGIRITTVVYGVIGTLPGLYLMFAGFDVGLASVVVPGLIWTVFGVIVAAAPVVPSGTAWFARPRY